MAPKLNSDAAKRNGSNGNGSADAAPNPYAPSVPISVYRELAAELQATKAMLESLHTQNQSLVRQNALLAHEVHTIVQSALNLQGLMMPAASSQTPQQMPQPKLADPPAIAPDTLPETPMSDRPTKVKASKPPKAPKDAPKITKVEAAPSTVIPPSAKASQSTTEPAASPIQFADLPPIANPDGFFTEQQESSRPSDQPTRQMSGLWLLLIVLAIMVTAFTAGFLVMRPILLKNSR